MRKSDSANAAASTRPAHQNPPDVGRTSSSAHKLTRSAQESRMKPAKPNPHLAEYPPGGAEQVPQRLISGSGHARAEAGPGGRPEDSAGCAGGGVGGAECVPQAGEVNGAPCQRGHLVQE